MPDPRGLGRGQIGARRHDAAVLDHQGAVVDDLSRRDEKPHSGQCVMAWRVIANAFEAVGALLRADGQCGGGGHQREGALCKGAMEELHRIHLPGSRRAKT
jgi:hypothetical protein